MQRDDPQMTIHNESSQGLWKDFPESPPANEQVGETKQESQNLKEAGAETVNRAKEKGEAILGEQKHQVAKTIQHCSDALHQAARELRDRQDANLARITENIAERFSKTSNYLERKPLQEIQNDLETFARQQPQVFYGGMFVAGLALSRLISSQSKSEPDTGSENI